MRYFGIKNIERFQHYRDRNPPWIKLYFDIWQDREFIRLQPASKLLHLGLCSLASRCEGRLIPEDPEWIAHKLALPLKAVDLKPLITAGFLICEQDASALLATCTQVIATPVSVSVSDSVSGKGESEGETDEDDPNSPTTAEELMEGWNDVCVPHGLSAVRDLSASRRKQIGLRLKEHPLTDFWQEVINHICGSPFLLGTNDRGWKVNFDWLFENDTNALKVYEGRYDKEKIHSRNGIGRTA